MSRRCTFASLSSSAITLRSLAKRRIFGLLQAAPTSMRHPAAASRALGARRPALEMRVPNGERPNLLLLCSTLCPPPIRPRYTTAFSPLLYSSSRCSLGIIP